MICDPGGLINMEHGTLSNDDLQCSISMIPCLGSKYRVIIKYSCAACPIGHRADQK